MLLILKSNSLKDIKTSFVSAVGGYYDDREAEQIFYLILENRMQLSKMNYLEESDKQLTESEILEFEKIALRLCDHEPIQYILGETFFADCIILVNKDVLIPRPETEELVQLIKDDLKEKPHRIIDIGSGSGCIAIALAKYFSDSDVLAMEISEVAINLAKTSANLNKVNVDFVNDDIHSIKKAYSKFDLIVSNPPYVEISRKLRLAKHVVNKEPDLALFVPSEDPLMYYKSISRFAKKYLADSGALYLEINEEYGLLTKQFFENEGFNVILKQDISQKDRFLKCIMTH